MSAKTKPGIGFFTLACCEGCQFTLLFIDEITKLLEPFHIIHFNLLKEKNPDEKFDLVFIEGAVTTDTERKEILSLRARSEYVVAMGSCACFGGIPAMRNFVESKKLHKYVYHHRQHPHPVPASGIGEHIHVDYYMPGCPIIKEEMISFLQSFKKGRLPEEYRGSVCDQCPRRGKDCLLKEKAECLGAVTRGGCGALCPSDNIPCMLCRGPTETAHIAAEIKLFEKFGLSEQDIHQRLNLFKNIEDPETWGRQP